MAEFPTARSNHLCERRLDCESALLDYMAACILDVVIMPCITIFFASLSGIWQDGVSSPLKWTFTQMRDVLQQTVSLFEPDWPPSFARTSRASVFGCMLVCEHFPDPGVRFLGGSVRHEFQRHALSLVSQCC